VATTSRPQGRTTPSLFTKRERYALAILSLGFILLSAVGHFITGAVGERMFPHFQEEATPPPQKVIVQTLIKPPPTPKPTPPPTPTPLPTPTPPPLKNTPPPPKIKLNVIKTHSEGGTGPAEVAYTPPPHGDTNGVPQGISTTAPATAAPPRSPVQITDAEMTNRVQPDYPDLAKEQGIQGTCIVEVVISTTGQVLSAKVFQSSGNALLDNEAIKAAKRSGYKPPSVTTPYLIEYDFKLE
jgi:periplasmic protein TonB